MEQLKSFKSITYILSGTLLYLYNGLSGGWTSGLAATFGFILFIKGLDMLKAGLDADGRSGAQLMLVGGIIGGISSLFALIPMIGFLSGIGFIISFVFILWGVVRFNSSAYLDRTGKSGSNQIIVAMIVAVLGAFVSLLPFVGNIVASLFALVSMLLAVTGWLKVQSGLNTSLAVE